MLLMIFRLAICGGKVIAVDHECDLVRAGNMIHEKDLSELRTGIQPLSASGKAGILRGR
jgi:hypothetical protein